MSSEVAHHQLLVGLAQLAEVLSEVVGKQLADLTKAMRADLVRQPHFGL